MKNVKEMYGKLEKGVPPGVVTHDELHLMVMQAVIAQDRMLRRHAWAIMLATAVGVAGWFV